MEILVVFRFAFCGILINRGENQEARDGSGTDVMIKASNGQQESESSSGGGSSQSGTTPGTSSNTTPGTSTNTSSGTSTNTSAGTSTNTTSAATPQAAAAAVQEPITVPKTPANVKVKAKKNKVTVSWKKIKKNKNGKKLLKLIRGIQVQYSTDPTFQTNVMTKAVKKNKTKVTLKLKRKTTYYIRVRYVGYNGYSNWSKIKRVKTK